MEKAQSPYCYGIYALWLRTTMSNCPLSPQPRGLHAFKQLDSWDVGAEVKNENLGVLPRAKDTPVVGSRRQNPALVPFWETQDWPARRNIPDLDVLVVGSRCQPSVGAVDMQGPDQAVMGLHLPQALPSVGIP